MVAHFTVRTHGVNQAFRFFEGIWLHRKSHQIRFFLSEKDLVYIIRAQREMSNHPHHHLQPLQCHLIVHYKDMRTLRTSTIVQNIMDKPVQRGIV